METNQALENLLSAKPENILQQLFFFNSKIHSANKDEILAIHFTLKGGQRMVKSGERAWGQIYELLNSCEGRMRALVAEKHMEPSEKEALKNLFETTANVVF